MVDEVVVDSEVDSLGGFVEAARNYYDIEGITSHEEGDNSVLEQEVGKGWPGMGYSPDGRLWMGLTPYGHRPNEGWNGNTLLKQGIVYKGVTPGEQGIVASEHPLAILFGALRRTSPELEFHLTGDHAEWQTDERTRLNFDAKGNLVGNMPVGTEIKVVVRPVQANWTDGGWIPGAAQKLEIIRPKPIQFAV